MDELTWTIVQFLEDLTVEAIPTSWIQGDYCYWPPYKQEKITSAIKKCESLNTTWPRHRITIFRNATFDDYGKARIKARVAEECSDLNSAGESTAGKRKRIKKILSSSSSDDSIYNNFKLSPPPKLSRSLTSSQFTDNMSLNSSQTNSMVDGNITLDNNKHQNGAEKNIDISLKDFSIPKVTPTFKSVLSSVAAVPTKPAATMREVTRTQSADGLNCCLQHDHTILTEIKNQNHMIRGILIDVLNEVRDLKNAKAGSSTTNSIFVKYPDINFPIANDDEMIRFEEELQNENNFTEAVNELAKFGGSNPYNFIKRTMSALVKDAMLMKYSWLGRKGKRCLEKSPVAKVLIRAADISLNCTQKQVEQAMQSFLKRSGERVACKENKRPVN